MGHRWIVAATDYLTHHAETKALQWRTASETAQFLIENGAPTLIITDRGTAFTAELLDTVLRLSDPSQQQAMAYHPQLNELTNT